MIPLIVSRSRVCLTAFAAILILAACTGCGVIATSGEPGSASPTPASRTLTGRVQGGQQPISGATVQLYAVSNTGFKGAATPLLTHTVTTAANGGFDITGLWNCADTATYGANPLLYLTATGGDPGAGADNPAIIMMAALGPCSNLLPSTFIFLDEVTTVASVYALAPFMADATHVGAPASKMQGLASAFDTVQVLANIATGTSPGTGVVAGVSVPVTTIYTLSDVLAACVNSIGGSTQCSTLFSATTPAGGSAPQDIINATLNIVSSPLNNVTTIFNQIGSLTPFQPVLNTAPSDWTLAVKMTGNGLAGPAGIAFDAAGNAWISNGGGAGVTALSSQGVALTGTSGYGTSFILGAQGIAVDRTGSVWITDPLLGSVFKLTVASGAITSSTAFTNGFTAPIAVAADSSNNIWVADFGGSAVIELSNSGNPAGSPLTANGTLQSPGGIAVDGGGSVWVTDNQTQIVHKFANNGTLLSGAGFSDTATLAPEGIAIDGSGRAFVANNGLAAVSVFAAEGVVAAPPLQGGGLALPGAIAIDGAGSAWVTNNTASGSISRVLSGGSSVSGGYGSLNAPAAIAVDASGNVWTANTGDNSVWKFIGLAAPVVTPLAANAGP